MKKFFVLRLFIITSSCFAITGCTMSVKSQVQKGNPESVINVQEVERIEGKLAADEMKGRKTFSPDIDKAADFIAEELRKAGLEKWKGNNSYLQQFGMIRAKQTAASGTINGQIVDARNIIAITCQPALAITQASGYEKAAIKAGANFFAEARKLIRANKNMLVCVDQSFATSFGNLNRFKSNMFQSANNLVFVLTDADPESYDITVSHEIATQKLANVVAVLPGKSMPDEYVVFSGHYDHLGVTSKIVNGDSIYNGANDDAAGTTAVIMLAKYFKTLGNNERTILFAAFTAEEVGGFGSQYFSKQLDPEKVVAMFNIEMIGTDSKWGKNSAYITGYEKTDMGALLQKNLEGTGFTFYPDPYPTQQLFYRSDNATLARLGVPAHTISTSKMDNEPNYHKVSDELSTLDMNNMTNIIRAIALSAQGIISGKQTPTRVNTEDLR